MYSKNFPEVAHGGVEDASLAVQPCPGGGIGSALVGLALHAGGVKREDHVEIRREVFQRIPFFGEIHRRSHAFEAGKFRVLHNEVGCLHRGLRP